MFPAATALTTAASLSSAVCVAKVVGTIVKSNVPPAVTTLEKIQVAVGSTVLTGVLAHAANNYVTSVVNDTVSVVKKFRAKDETAV